MWAFLLGKFLLGPTADTLLVGLAGCMCWRVSIVWMVAHTCKCLMPMKREKIWSAIQLCLARPFNPLTNATRKKFFVDYEDYFRVETNLSNHFERRRTLGLLLSAHGFVRRAISFRQPLIINELDTTRCIFNCDFITLHRSMLYRDRMNPVSSASWFRILRKL